MTFVPVDAQRTPHLAARQLTGWRPLLFVFLLPLFLVACGWGDGSDLLSATTADTRPEAETEQCFQDESEVEVFVTEFSVEYVRTPDACFDALAAYPFKSNYVEVDGLRMHYVDEGPADGEVVLMLHGQPSWSYLYRKMIPVLAAAGYRVIATDHIGMGRSDKPIDPRVHQYEQHVAWTKQFIERLELDAINLFVQDWGSLIGLRVAGDMPEKVARIVLANGDMLYFNEGTNPFTAPVFEIDESLGDALSFFSTRSRNREQGFQEWITYAAQAPSLTPGDIVELGTVIELTEAERESYNAPFPSLIYKAAIRAFPSMVAGIGMETLPAWNALGTYTNPFLALAGARDPNLGSEATQNKWINHVPGAKGNDHRRFDAAHFIQDDVGESMAEHVLAFFAETEPASTPIGGGPLFNFRYCEILLAYPRAGQIEAEVWGTQGVNQCPQPLWDALDFGDIAAEYGALLAVANGPRFFVTDSTSASAISSPGDDTEIRVYGDLPMRFLTTVSVAPSGEDGGSSRYMPGAVVRDNAWFFVTGRRIYELEDPQGQRWVMQSFSRSVDPELQLEDLELLGDRLELPAGWRFSSRVLTEPLEVLTVDGIAMVLQDDLGNSYQLLPCTVGCNDASNSANEETAPRVGFNWLHAATIVQAGRPLDEDGLLNASTVRKYHELTFDAGSTLVLLVS